MKLDASQFELVTIEGELALVLRLGRHALDNISALERARRAYRVEVRGDPLRLFLPACCQVKTGARAKARPLYDTYKQWAVGIGETPINSRQFHAAMKARGFEQITSNGRWWLDLELIGIPKAQAVD